MLWILLGLIGIILLAAYCCYRMAFYAPSCADPDSEVIEIPEGAEYEPFREDMERWVREIRQMPHQVFYIKSRDGLTLRGKFYEYAPGAPIELMFHGYRGNAERDLSGGVQRCFQVGRSALVVDQRCSRGSEGHTITFGIREREDCLEWIDFAIEHFGPDVKLILTGISMGAATVLMAAGEELPPNVIGILADCGYNSAKAIIFKVLRDMKLPPVLCYPIVRLGARLFGGFDLEEYSPEEAMKTCKLPVIFFHGGSDNFVPPELSEINFEACNSRKKLVIIPGAAHGLSYLVDPERYLQELRDFFGPDASYCAKIP